MNTCTVFRRTIATLFCAAIAVAALAGCDAMGPNSPNDDTASSQQIQGRVTSEDGADERLAASRQTASPIRSSTYGSSSGAVEGAVVTAARIDASGATKGLTVSGQATTSAEGRYDIEVADPSPIVLLTAEQPDEDFKTQVIVSTKGTSQVQAMPMTAESNGEAQVYVAVKTQDEDGSPVTPADVVVRVNHDIAAELESSAASAADIASAIRAAASAEAAFYAEAGGSEVDHEQALENKEEAFLQLQAQLAKAGSAEAEAHALNNFETALTRAYASASAEEQAQALQTAASAAHGASADLPAQAQLGLQKKADVLAARATAASVEAALKANGASSAQLDTLAEARAELLSSLHAASSAEALDSAKADYRSAIETELESVLDVSTAAIEEAKTKVHAAAQSALDAALDRAQSQLEMAGTVAESRAQFYADAEAAAASSLEAGGASNADAGAQVLAVLGGMESGQ